MTPFLCEPTHRLNQISRTIQQGPLFDFRETYDPFTAFVFSCLSDCETKPDWAKDVFFFFV